MVTRNGTAVVDTSEVTAAAALDEDFGLVFPVGRGYPGALEERYPEVFTCFGKIDARSSESIGYTVRIVARGTETVYFVLTASKVPGCSGTVDAGTEVPAHRCAEVLHTTIPCTAFIRRTLG